MDNSASIIAFQQYYNEGLDLYKAGDIQGAREKLLKAAELAANIAKSSSNVAVHDQFLERTNSILEFVHRKCSSKKVVENTQKSGTSNEDEEGVHFQPVDTTLPENRVTFEDVAGLDEVKDEIKYKVIEPLNHPEFAKIYKVEPGAKILLYGPPGTGKTFIAKAIASELGCVFYSIQCTDLLSKYMGDSPKLIRQLFEEAQENEKAAIFFDEFDALVPKRDAGGDATNQERNTMVSSFLTCIDGFTSKGKCKMLLLIGATNIPWQIDPAILRGGRFETKIYIGLPDPEARLFLVKKCLKEVPIEDNFDLNNLVQRLDGFGGADITSICKDIINQAYRRGIHSQTVSKVNNSDVDYVLGKWFPSSSPEDLARYEEYKNNRN